MRRGGFFELLARARRTVPAYFEVEVPRMVERRHTALGDMVTISEAWSAQVGARRSTGRTATGP